MTTTASESAYGLNLEATIGADLGFVFNITQAAGGLTGTTGTAEVLNATTNTSAVVSSFTGGLTVLTDTTASVTVSLTKAQIDTLVATGTRTFLWRLNVTKSGLITPWFAGQLAFLPPGTPSSTPVQQSFTMTPGGTSIAVTLTVAANTAANIAFTPTGTIAATTVQDAIAEVALEAVQTSVLTTNGDILTRAAGIPARIDRATLAADTAFTTTLAQITRLNGTRQLPAAALAHTMARVDANAAGSTALTSGQQLFTLMWLPVGLPVNTISFLSGTVAAVSPTNQWFGLYDVNRNKLAVTADDTTTAWNAGTLKTLTIAGGYTIPADGFYYLTCMVAAATPPSFVTLNIPASSINNLPPVVCGRDATNTGLTTPGTAPATAAALTAVNVFPYAYVS